MGMPYVYRKIAGMLGGKGMMTLPQFQEEMTRVRIEKREALPIIRELERHGILVLDMSKNANQHTTIRVCSKGVAGTLVMCAGMLAYAAAAVIWSCW